jgi:hypothetical protein
LTPQPAAIVKSGESTPDSGGETGAPDKVHNVSPEEIVSAARKIADQLDINPATAIFIVEDVLALVRAADPASFEEAHRLL